MKDFSNDTLLVIAPHPDDEVVGCGGLISRIKEDGGKIFVLYLTNGTTNDFSDKGVSTAEEREDEIKEVANFFKYDGYKIAFPGNKYHLRLDSLSQKDLMGEIERGTISLENLNPSIIAFPTLNDYNQDHRVVANAAFASCRPAPSESKKIPRLVISYEHPTGGWGISKDNYLNFFISLSKKNLGEKIQSLRLFKSQVRKTPHPRSLESVESLAKYRGALCGILQAEAYYLHRIKY